MHNKKNERSCAMSENNGTTLFRVGDIGCDNEIILQFWDFRRQSWNHFPARRVEAGKYVTSSGKTGTFQEKPLTPEECKLYQEKAPEKVARYPWRDCKQSREFCEKMLAAGMDKEEIKKSLSAMFPLTPSTKTAKPNVFDSIM